MKESMSKIYAFCTEDWVKIGPPQVTGSLVCLGAGGQTKGARRINRFSIDLHVSAYAGGKERISLAAKVSALRIAAHMENFKGRSAFTGKDYKTSMCLPI